MFDVESGITRKNHLSNIFQMDSIQRKTFIKHKSSFIKIMSVATSFASTPYVTTTTDSSWKNGNGRPLKMRRMNSNYDGDGSNNCLEFTDLSSIP